MNIFQRVWDSIGFGDQYDDAEFEYEYDGEGFSQDAMFQDDPTASREVRSHPQAALPNNVIGMPNRTAGRSEMVLFQPRSFEEMPQVVSLLRERKSVVLNLILMDPDQAQRSVDFVSGGVYAIDGHQERLGENIFLFTPSIVHITAYTPGLGMPPQSGMGMPSHTGVPVPPPMQTPMQVPVQPSVSATVYPPSDSGQYRSSR